MKKAQYMYDIESNSHLIEITSHTNKKNFIYSKPKGNWTIIEFTRYDQICESDFLSLMVQQNLDTLRRIAYLEVTRILKDITNWKRIKIMHCIHVLDSSFIPPYINLSSEWQVELLNTLTNHTVFNIINSSKNYHSIKRFCEVLKEVK